MVNRWIVIMIPVICRCVCSSMSVSIKVCQYTSVECISILALLCDVSFLHVKYLSQYYHYSLAVLYEI